MGVVYKAQDTKLDRAVALKFLPEHVSAGSDELERFIQEAKAAAGLNHPNICTIHGIEESDSKHFIVMEYVDGQTLLEKKSSLSMKQALDVGIQIAEGLAAAHDKGIVHRDIKPENILFRKDGRVQVMDFGLALLRGASRLTKEGSTVGTVGYMSPEQVQGLDSDHRSDIFSLGVILYELYAGRSPFKGVHETAISYEIVNVDAIPINVSNPDIDPELERLVLECLVKDPRDRSQSAAELARNLRHLKSPSSRDRKNSIRTGIHSASDNKGDSNDPFERGPMHRWQFAIVFFAIGILVGLVLMKFVFTGADRTISSPIPRLHTSIVLPEDVPLILGHELPTIGFNSPLIAISPDASMLAYVANTTSNQMIYIIDLSSSDIRPMEGTEGATHPFFSPDGAWLGFLTQDRVKKIPSAGGPVIPLCEATTPVMAWWIDSDDVYFTENQQTSLSRVSSDGTGKETVLTDPAHSLGGTVLSGGTHVLAVKNFGISNDHSDIVLIDIATQQATTLVRAGYAPIFIQSGHILFARANSLMAIRFDADAMEIIGEPFTLAKDVSMESLFGISQVAGSKAGVLAFVYGSDISVGKPAWVSSNGDVEYFDVPERVYGVVDLAPDDSRLAVHVADVRDYLWIWDLNRLEGRRLPGEKAEGWPRWSTSGFRLMSTATRSEGRSILIRDMTAGGTSSGLLTIDRNNLGEGWSPDDEVINTNQGRQSTGLIQFHGLERKVDVVEFVGSFGTISPDGKLIAYKSVQTGNEEVFLRTYPEGKVVGQVSIGGGTEPLWLSSSKLMYRNGQRWYSIHVSTGRRIRWDPPQLAFATEFIDTPGWSYDISSDGQKLLVVKRTKPLASNRIDIITNWQYVDEN
jgi:serine/threonine protein kinase